MTDIKLLKSEFEKSNWLAAQEIRQAEAKAQPARDAYLAALEGKTDKWHTARVARISKSRSAHIEAMDKVRRNAKPRKR